MIVRDYLSALHELPIGSMDELTGGQPFLVLSPHPDDETLGCGGLLALAAARHLSAEVMILTDGSASHPSSKRYPPARLAALRRAETEAAMTKLGLRSGALTCLGLKDAEAPTAGPAFDDAVQAIANRAEQIGARSLFVTWNHDPHCDHEAGYAIAQAAAARLGNAKLWAYPIWGWHLDSAKTLDVDPPRGLRLDIAAVRGLKHEALRCYASQMTDLIGDDPGGFSFSPEQLAPFLGEYEYFVEAL